MAYEKTAAGGLGWTEMSLVSIDTWKDTAPWGCSGTGLSRQICFMDNDVLEQTTAQRAGCVRAHTNWLGGEHATECRTDARNLGHIWCCPDNNPRPIPTTPEQRARDAALIIAEQQARDEGRLNEQGQLVQPVQEESQQSTTTQDQGFLSRISLGNKLLISGGILATGLLAVLWYQHSRRVVSRG